MSETLPLAEAKSKFSEMVDRVEHTHDRIVVTRNGRTAAAMISPDELASLCVLLLRHFWGKRQVARGSDMPGEVGARYGSELSGFAALPGQLRTRSTERLALRVENARRKRGDGARPQPGAVVCPGSVWRHPSQLGLSLERAATPPQERSDLAG